MGRAVAIPTSPALLDERELARRARRVSRQLGVLAFADARFADLHPALERLRVEPDAGERLRLLAELVEEVRPVVVARLGAQDAAYVLPPPDVLSITPSKEPQ